MLIHARSRFFDLANAIQEPHLDVGIDTCYVEVRTDTTKTSNRPNRRRLPVTLVGLGYGITGGAWAAMWVLARSNEGLKVGN
eukprot:8693353-Karenia_brevis.AAC.1